jgi:hypothetical protein
MTDPLSTEPTRLLDDPDLDPSLRHDLELARVHSPIAYSVDAGLARFEQAIHGASTMPPGGSIAGLRVLGWFLGAAVVLGGVGYWLTALRGGDDQVARADTSAATVRSEEELVADPPSSDVHENLLHAASAAEGPLVHESIAEAGERAGAGDAGTAPTQAEGGSPELDAPAPPRSTSKPARPGPVEPNHEAPSLADEAAQINAARKALASDPSKTLALMQAAEQQFPNGAMIEERRGYTILALVALGRTTEAEAAADAYLERWPKGTLSRRVREALGR